MYNVLFLHRSGWRVQPQQQRFSGRMWVNSFTGCFNECGLLKVSKSTEAVLVEEEEGAEEQIGTVWLAAERG